MSSAASGCGELSEREHAEGELVGGVMARGRVEDLGALGVAPSHFWAPWFRAAWEAVVDLHARGEVHGPDQVEAWMISAGTINMLRMRGGVLFLWRCASEATACNHLAYWACIVRRCPRCGR